MEENQEKKQGGGKGILIIIAIIIVAVAAYFAVKAVNKKDTKNSPTVSISEADKLELSSLNLNGKWDKTVGSDKYELNFKSTKELVLTQYDSNGEVKVKSDEGAYSVDNGVLNLTVTANGEAITATATVVLSDKYLIITVTAGNSLFAGTYTANRGDMPNVDNSSDVESTVSSVSSQSVASAPESNISTPDSDPSSVYDHLSPYITELLTKTPSELFELSSTVGEGNYGVENELIINGRKIGVNYADSESRILKSITVPIDMLFSYPKTENHPEIKGKSSYTYEELQAIYGDKIGNEASPSGYKIFTRMDDSLLVFYGEYGSGALDLDMPIKSCEVFCSGENVISQLGITNSDIAEDSVYKHITPSVIELLNKTPLELFNMSSSTDVPPEDMLSLTLKVDGYEQSISINYTNSNGNPTENSKLTSMGIGINMLLSYSQTDKRPQINGKRSYIFKELCEIYGKNLKCEPTLFGGYQISANIDGYRLEFNAYKIDDPITYCKIICNDQ